MGARWQRDPPTTHHTGIERARNLFSGTKGFLGRAVPAGMKFATFALTLRGSGSP